MTKFVFEAEIIVPHYECQTHRFALDGAEMEALMAKIPPLTLGIALTLEELQDLIQKDGQLSGVLKLKGDKDTREHVLKTLAAHAWLNDIPWTVTASRDDGIGDSRFGRLLDAYMEESK